jgi:hypothetical protein
MLPPLISTRPTMPRHRHTRSMNDVRFDPASSQPSGQPKAVPTGLEGDDLPQLGRLWRGRVDRAFHGHQSRSMASKICAQAPHQWLSGNFVRDGSWPCENALGSPKSPSNDARIGEEHRKEQFFPAGRTRRHRWRASWSNPGGSRMRPVRLLCPHLHLCRDRLHDLLYTDDIQYTC